VYRKYVNLKKRDHTLTGWYRLYSRAKTWLESFRDVQSDFLELNPAGPRVRLCSDGPNILQYILYLYIIFIFLYDTVSISIPREKIGSYLSCCKTLLGVLSDDETIFLIYWSDGWTYILLIYFTYLSYIFKEQKSTGERPKKNSLTMFQLLSIRIRLFLFWCLYEKIIEPLWRHAIILQRQIFGQSFAIVFYCFWNIYKYKT